jgi:hypothetical protein
MKTKILVLLLLAFSSVSIAQTTVANKLKNKRQHYQYNCSICCGYENNGEVNKIAKVDLIDVLNFASAVNLPTTGLANKFILLMMIKNIYMEWYNISAVVNYTRC